MATTLTTPSFKASLTFGLAKTVAGFGSATLGPQTISATITPSSSVADECLSKQYTITAAGTQLIDLFSFTDAFGDTIVGASCCGIFITVAGATSVIELKADASDGLIWPMKDVTDTIVIRPGGFFAYGEPTGFTIDATHKELLLTNSGAATATVTVAILVKR